MKGHRTFWAMLEGRKHIRESDPIAGGGSKLSNKRDKAG